MYQQPLKFDMTLLLIRENKLAIRYILLFFVTAFFFLFRSGQRATALLGRQNQSYCKQKRPQSK